MSDTIIMTRLKELRANRGVSQEVAAEGCGISRITLARYENGTREPNYECTSKLADYYGVSVDYLMGREEASDNAVQTMAYDTKIKDVADILQSLDETMLHSALEYIRFLKSQKEVEK